MRGGASLFECADLAPLTPTTREVALLVKSRGPGALPGATERADGARYQEVTCRSALNRVEGMPFRWTLNPYRGCTHGCHYCFARRYQAQFELDPDESFSSLILVKVNFADVLRRELASPRWRRELVAFGTATDPYQPIEGHYQLTRRSLEALVWAATPTALVTKGPMAVRDRDLFVELGRRAACTVSFSVPTVDEEAWRMLEPGTASPWQRLRALRQLREAGVHAGVLVAPIVPGITSQPAKLERTMKAIADHGAAFVGANLLHLDGGTREHFLKFIGAAFPALLPLYERLYPRKYAPKAYADKVYALVAALQTQHDLGRHRDGSASSSACHSAAAAPPSAPARPRQAAFEWDEG
jgi:DNA repair photolyase